MVCDAALVHGVKRLVHISTIAVVGNPGAGEIIDEETMCYPQDAYRTSKLSAETLVLQKITQE